MDSLDQDSDESLMVRIKRADHQAFAVLVKRHSERFYAVAYRTCRDQVAAEDIVQEAFLKLWNKPQNWKAGKGAKFTTWFYRVVINQAHDHGRKKRAEYGSEILDTFEDSTDLQDTALEDKQQQGALEDAIQSLPERQRDALNLCFYEGLSNKDAAQILGVKVKALESLLMRAKAKLKAELIRAGAISPNMEQEKNYG